MPGLIDSMRQKADQVALEADKLMRIRREQEAISNSDILRPWCAR